jgi:hypothetical protein
MAIVYEVVTPYHRDDVVNLRIVQELNLCYLFCFKSDGTGDYQMYILRRLDTFNWTLAPMVLEDGPYMDVNVTTTKLIPVGKGSWVPDMTGPATPSGLAVASSEVVGHEAWRAFDDDSDTYWEGNASQEGWLEYSFETGFVNALPLFTGATTGGMTIATSAAVAGFEGWRAADQNPDTDWRSGADLPQEWRIDLGAAHTVMTYAMRASKDRVYFAPADWTLSGSNTAITGPWTVVDTRTAFKWDSGERKLFNSQTPASFRYYRINVTKVNRKTTVVVTPAVGKKGTKGYVPAFTTTTRTNNYAGFASIQFSYALGTPKAVDGYTIYLGRYAKGKDVTNHAPKTWYFEGWDGTKWWLLDAQQGYTNWDEYRSRFFELQNREIFSKYRIRIKNVSLAGDVNPRIGRLTLSSPNAPGVNFTATGTIGINDDQGFLPTDVGRQLRIRDADNIWRWLKITSVLTTTQITAAIGTPQPATGSDPLVLDNQVKFWRLGLWSDTTGWPTCGTLHEDRLFVGGASGFPDTVVGSNIGRHEKFTHISYRDVVTASHAMVVRCNSKFMSRIVWIKSCVEALRIGTGKGEFVLSAPGEGGLSALNLSIRQTTNRGGAARDAVMVDNDVVFLQKHGRSLYSLAFTLTATGAQVYKSQLMSKLGSHLLDPEVVQIVYQQEPHSIIWGRRADDSVVAMTYTSDEDVFGGHRHDFSCKVKDLCTLESSTDHQDALWMVVMRNVNGQDVHYIERLYRFWDFGDQLSVNATFLDSALRYYGALATDKVYGLRHMEGKYLDVLADRIVYKHVGPVVNGMLQLERTAFDIVVGLPVLREGEIISPELGAQDGTAQGKSKRPHSVVLRMWQSARGEVGRWDEDHGELMWTPCDYNSPQASDVPEITLLTCLTKTIVLPGGYGTLGTVRFRQTDPVPFNVAGIYPQAYVEDER